MHVLNTFAAAMLQWTSSSKEKARLVKGVQGLIIVIQRLCLHGVQKVMHMKGW
jgi:hypothetical protein